MNLKTILIAIVFVLIGFAVVMLLGYFGIAPFDMIYGMVTGWISGFNMQEVIENPASIATIAGTGITTAVGVAVPLMSKVNSAKQQVTETANTAKTQIDKIKTDTSTQIKELTDQKTKLTQDYESQIKTLEDKLKNPDTSIVKNLEGQVEAIQDQHSTFIKGLMTAANGALIASPITGQTYSVLKVPPEVQVK